MEFDTIHDRHEIIDLLNRYATACDTRDWDLFKEIFTTDVETDYGGDYKFVNRQSIVNLIRSMLGGCGPTQHLLGNYRINLEKDRANSICSVRAFHAGTGDAEGQTFEMWGEYRDKLRRTKAGWRIVQRELAVTWIEGSAEVLKPE